MPSQLRHPLQQCPPLPLDVAGNLQRLHQLALEAKGWPLKGVAGDTALSAYVVRPDQRSYDLGDLSLRYLKRELRDEAEDSGQLTLDTDNIGSESGMLRARATRACAQFPCFSRRSVAASA